MGVLRAIHQRGVPVTKTELGDEIQRGIPLDAAISFLWRNGYLARHRRPRDDEFEYSVKNMKGVTVKRVTPGEG